MMPATFAITSTVPNSRFAVCTRPSTWSRFVTSVGTATVPDVYDESWNPREIYALQSVVRPGNSGGPVLTADGAVAGVVFARAENDEDLGYAMTMAELTPVAAQAPSLSDPVSSGSCVG